MTWIDHYDAIYAALGVAAMLTLDDSAGTELALTVIDKTAGVEVAMGGDVRMATVAPVAAVRAYEVTEQSVALAELKGGTLEFNGKTWQIESLMMRPSPDGELQGEVYLILIEPAA